MITVSSCIYSDKCAYAKAREIENYFFLLAAFSQPEELLESEILMIYSFSALTPALGMSMIAATPSVASALPSCWCLSLTAVDARNPARLAHGGGFVKHSRQSTRLGEISDTQPTTSQLQIF